ncbi:MAG: hypothetical protein EPO32_12265 [Anaerolineae bacterium]|nr:MAG: hypothetical protein EPO32_12265 [Anaerolineae bacterium]
MKTPILIGLTAAVITGIIITAQATLLARSGSGSLGAARTGMFTYLLGGALAGLILGVVYAQPDRPVVPGLNQTLVVAMAGAMGVAILTGIAYSGPRIGVGAAMAAMLLGQMVTSMIVDAFGWGGELIPITLPRLIGLAALAVGTWLLLPKT